MRRSGRYRVIVLPAAQLEFRRIVRWYQDVNPAAAEGFRAAWREGPALLAEAPLRWAEVTPGVRRLLLRRYPYKLIYKVKTRESSCSPSCTTPATPTPLPDLRARSAAEGR